MCIILLLHATKLNTKLRKDANQRWDFDWETRLDVRLYDLIGSAEILDFYYYISIFILIFLKRRKNHIKTWDSKASLIRGLENFCIKDKKLNRICTHLCKFNSVWTTHEPDLYYLSEFKTYCWLFRYIVFHGEYYLFCSHP